MIDEGVLTESEKEIYEYAVIMHIFNVLPFVMASILVPVTKLKYEGYILILPFALLRRYCGGFHFKNCGVCLFVSTLYLYIMEQIGKEIKTSFVLIFLTSLCLVYLYFVSCNISSQKCTSDTAKKRNFRATIIFSLMYISLFFSIIDKNDHFAKWIYLGIIMTFILQLPLIFQNIIKKAFHITES